MVNLIEAAKKNNEVNIGITYDEFLSNKGLHKNIYFDKWGFSWKLNKKEELMYSDSHYKNQSKHWEYANLDGYDLPFLKLLTLEEFEKAKPQYL